MGNKAVITTQAKNIGVYLYWNGGRDSVEAFLLYCKIKGYRAPENDCYGWARLCQVIGNFFGDGLSVGIDRYNRLDTDNGDNGVYIIKDWEIIGREFYEGEEQDAYDLLETLEIINSDQPEKEQVNYEILKDAVKNYSRKTITPKQIKAVHAVVRDLGWTDYRYRKLLGTMFDATSCKDLTENQASILIETLNKLKG